MDLKAKVFAAGLAAAVAFVPVYEGLRYRPYKDPVGIWTDCYGHTGKDVVPGRVNTQGQCDVKLYQDLLTANATVDRCTKVPLTDNQRSAFVSFAFNVGPGGKGVKDGYCTLKSGVQPSFLRKLNSRDYIGACNGLSEWTQAGGQVLPGLVKRRAHEVKVCLTP